MRAIFAIVEDKIEETYDFWADEKFVAELQQREKSFFDSTTKTYSLDQTIAHAKMALKKAKGK